MFCAQIPAAGMNWRRKAPKNRVGDFSSRVLRPCPVAGKRQAETHCAYVIEPIVALALVRVFCGHRIPHGT